MGAVRAKPKPVQKKTQEERVIINGSYLWFTSCSVKNWKATDGRERV